MASRKYIFLLLIFSCFIFVSCNKNMPIDLNNENAGLTDLELTEKDFNKNIDEGAYSIIYSCAVKTYIIFEKDNVLY